MTRNAQLLDVSYNIVDGRISLLLGLFFTVKFLFMAGSSQRQYFLY